MNEARTCSECGETLKDDGVYEGGYCFRCGKGFGERRKFPPVKWGPGDDAHIENIEKWLKEEYRDDEGIKAMIAGFVLPKRTFGNCILGYMQGKKILRAELIAREASRKGDKVVREGSKVIHADTATAKVGAGEPEMMTIRQAADYVRKSEKTIRTWIGSKDANGNEMLPGVLKVGKRRLIPRTSLDMWRKG